MNAEQKGLAITCTKSDCANNLHSFKKSRKMTKEEQGRCRSCGIDLIHWERVQKRDYSDLDFTFSSLKKELFRHHYWETAIDQQAENHALRKGRIKLKAAVVNRITRSIAPGANQFDGRQTPKAGNIIFYAQHALACCCRTCIEYWHGIPKGEALDSDAIHYFSTLIEKYIDLRLGDKLQDEPQRVPYLRRDQDSED